MINLLALCIYLYLSLFTLYYFQIKEYRFDRFISYVKEKGLVWMFFQNKFVFPSRSQRNILIILFSYTLFVVSFNLFTIPLLLLFWVTAVSIVSIYLGVLITQPLSKFIRQKTVSAAIAKLSKHNVQVIVITGSFGKSSVKEYLYEILSKQFNVAKTDKNQNTDVGVALGVLNNIKDDTQYFIAEVGAYTKGEIASVVSWLKPSYAILTGIGNQHLDLFGSKENLINAKLEIAATLSSDAPFYINADTIAPSDIKSRLNHENIISYSMYSALANIYFRSVTKIKDQTYDCIVFYYPNNSHMEENFVYEFHTNLTSEHMLLNLLPCISLASDLGMSKEQVEAAVSELQPIENKLTVHKGINNITFINDSYNSSVDGFSAAVKYLSTFDQHDKFVLSKGIIELGSEKLPSYKKLLSQLTDSNIDLYTNDKDFGNQENVWYFKNESDLLEMINKLPADSVVLIEGRFTKKFMKSIGLN